MLGYGMIRAWPIEFPTLALRWLNKNQLDHRNEWQLQRKSTINVIKGWNYLLAKLLSWQQCMHNECEFFKVCLSLLKHARRHMCLCLTAVAITCWSSPPVMLQWYRHYMVKALQFVDCSDSTSCSIISCF